MRSAYWERHHRITSEPGFQLCVYMHEAGHSSVGPDNWSGYSNSFGKGTLSIPLMSQLEESSDVTWYSSSSHQKTFTQQKQMLGPNQMLPLRDALKNQGFTSRFSFHSNTSHGWLVSPQTGLERPQFHPAKQESSGLQWKPWLEN